MDEKQGREYHTIVLAALLHDIGKFYQRGLDEKERKSRNHASLGLECFQKFFSEKIKIILGEEEKERIASTINTHHDNAGFVTLADALSAGMEKIALDEEETENPSEECLLSIFDAISLGNHRKNDQQQYAYYLKPLSLEKKDLFPGKYYKQILTAEYNSLWENFITEIKYITAVNSRSYLNGLYAVLQKYTCCIPSAAYKYEPDISLFDHAKITAAIAGCLYNYEKAGEFTDKKFLLVAGDISGIQSFIYRITKSQGEGGISKRLRGRSFYLLLLQEVIAKYIIERVGLFITNILFCGGGRFELLLPNTSKVVQIVAEVRKDVNKWLIEECSGELSLLIEGVEACERELIDYGSLLMRLDDTISMAKKKKFSSSFEDVSFWCEETSKSPKICKVCGISKVTDDEPCNHCKLHKEIGSILPKTLYLIYAKDREDINVLRVPFSKFGTVYLVSQDIPIKESWLKPDKVLDIQKVNDLKNLNTGFRFIGNTAPVAKESFAIDSDTEDEDKTVDEGKVLSFEMLANASIGDNRLGILKMDVDHLGLIFAIGLEEDIKKSESKQKIKSISRISALSRSMDIFFSGYLNKICVDIFDAWHAKSDNNWKHKDKVKQIFYTIYSGGDDLMIVGPWSEMAVLAKKIRDEFKVYTCNNVDINISAGIFFCKPKYPISLAAEAAGDELETSKDKGRKRITIFGETVEWIDGESIGFNNLLDCGETFFEAITAVEKENRLPRGFIHGLLRKHKQYESGDDLNYIPALIYQMERNIKNNAKIIGIEKTLKEYLKEKLLTVGNGYFRKIRIPASYALLKSRKGG